MLRFLVLSSWMPAVRTVRLSVRRCAAALSFRSGQSEQRPTGDCHCQHKDCYRYQFQRQVISQS